MDWFKIGKGVHQGYTLSPCLLTCRVHHTKCWAGWIISWNQDCWEKYQQPQICRWYHSYGREWRGTEEHHVEDERGEWKSWLKSQQTFKKWRSWHLVPSLHGKQMGKKWKWWQILLYSAPKSLQMVTSAPKLKDACFWRKSYDKLRQCIKKQRHHFANKGPYSQSYGFSYCFLWLPS